MFGMYHVCKDAIAAHKVSLPHVFGADWVRRWRRSRAAGSIEHVSVPPRRPIKPHSQPSNTQGVSVASLGFSDNLLAGGIGGTTFWLACYPADIIKSKLQTDSYGQPRYRGMLDCGRQVVAAEGVRGLFRGFGPALMRSFPANAVCFATYEAVASVIGARIGG
jgi:hypothetical protein